MIIQHYHSIHGEGALPRVLDGSGHQLPVLDHRLEHLRHRLLVKDTLLLALHRQVDVDAAALGSRDLNAQAFLGQENVAGVSGVKLDRWSRSGDLQLERR